MISITWAAGAGQQPTRVTELIAWHHQCSLSQSADLIRKLVDALCDVASPGPAKDCDNRPLLLIFCVCLNGTNSPVKLHCVVANRGSCGTVQSLFDRTHFATAHCPDSLRNSLVRFEGVTHGQ